MSTAVSQNIVFVNEMHVYKPLWRMGKNSSLEFIEIEFGNWRILNPRRFSI